MARGKGGRISDGASSSGNVWWYRFTWKGEAIRESTKQTNKRVAEQIEAAHKTSLAKGEVGIRDRVQVPTLKVFIETKFSPYIEARFLCKINTLDYYRAGIKNLNGFARLANCRLDKITVQDIAAFVRTRRDAGLQVTSVNRQLEVLRRIFKLAEEWNVRTEKRLPRVEMLRGERHRDRVLSRDEEDRYSRRARPRWEYKFRMHIRARLAASAPDFGGTSQSSPKTRSCYATSRPFLLTADFGPRKPFASAGNTSATAR